MGVGAIILTSLAGAPAAHADQTPGARHTLGASPSWARPAARSATVPSGQTIAIRVAMKNSHQPQIDAFIRSVTDPYSPQYGRYLTPAQYNKLFAPSSADVKKVTSFLTSQGITVTSVAGGNKWVNASGSAAALTTAFDTSLNTYSHGGKKQYAPATGPSVPSSLAGVVSGVSGLVQNANVHTTNRVRPAPDTGTNTKVRAKATKPAPQPCSEYWGQHQQTLPSITGGTGTSQVNTFLCGLVPSQLRSLYGTAPAVSHGATGRGVTVAVIDAYGSPTMEQDANQYARTVGDKPFTRGQYSEKLLKPYDNQDACGGESGWNGEQTMDVEAVHGMAPGAHVLYVGASDCGAGIDDAQNWIVETKAATIVSNSYGWTGEPATADDFASMEIEHAIAQQAAAEGIGFYFSSGDAGDNVVNGLSPQPNYESSDPYVTAVGGTSELVGRHNRLVARTGWETVFDRVDYSGDTPAYMDGPVPGDYFYSGAGGGVSTVFAQPWYQRGRVPAGQASGKRVVPDVAADADPYTGMQIGMTGYADDGESFGLQSWGGTSLACPLVAGIQALAQEGRHVSIGFANPLLYALPRSAITDVTPHKTFHFSSLSGTYLGTFDAGDTQKIAYGYDDETGLGVPGLGTILAEKLPRL